MATLTSLSLDLVPTLVFVFVSVILLVGLIRLSFVLWFALVHPHESLHDFGRDWFEEEDRGYIDPFYDEPMTIEIIDRKESFDE